ncbi:MAG TPA: N,N-dimethylformamidase beta subunit family domain-containing protein [Mycobacteriales bacterium]|nr:N,N-dimethylformamidase beta subunit family domain-containing protein [Mycobacteriales bacterium]
MGDTGEAAASRPARRERSWRRAWPRLSWPRLSWPRRAWLTRLLLPLLLSIALVGIVAERASPPGGPSTLGPPGAAANPAAPGADPAALIRAENARPGSPGWRITRTGAAHEIEGWAARTDVLPGQPLPVSVSTTAPTFTATAYRMGWYGGALARQVWVSPATLPGTTQPPATVSAVYPTGPTYTVSTRWSPSLTLDTTGWLPGAYLLRLDASTGGQRFVPFTVRSPDQRGRLVLMNAVTTWQAYNDYGGYSLYHGPDGQATDRARVVSFDRPYAGDGAGEFQGNELPLIALAERLGLPLGYATDVDLSTEPHLLDGARGLISLGHDEYWTRAMRTHATAARDAGVNIAFLGANALFRQMRFAASPVGPDRLEVDYKGVQGDPLRYSDPKDVTVNWREPPVAEPESSLTGTLYECNPVDAPLVINDPSSWLWSGLVQRGRSIPHLVGSEYDRVNPGSPTPPGIQVLTHSPVTCRGAKTYSDSAYYTTPSGAGVFDAGTSLWVASLAGRCQVTCFSRADADLMRAVTGRLLSAFAAGPAGVPHPAVSNLPSLHEFAGDPTYGAGRTLNAQQNERYGYG